MEQNELVIFENFSILNQKAMALPIGKVSIRQVLLITAGFFLATLVYLATTDLMYASGSFVPFVVMAMINTKIVSLDQIIRNNLSFLIRGTSLSKKYLNHIKSKSEDDSAKNKEFKITTIDEKKKKKSIFSPDGIIQSIESLILRKPKDSKENKSENQKEDDIKKKTTGDRFVTLSINHEKNVLVLSNLKSKNKKVFSKKKEKISEYLESKLDGITLAESDYTIKKGTVTITLHKSKKYSIKVNDEKIIIQ